MSSMPDMIAISTRPAKRILAAHLRQTCPEHLRFLMRAGEVFGEVVIVLPEDKILRKELEKMRD